MYIDPGSGGMLFQILAVAFGVISGTVLMFSGKIKMTIAKWRRSMRKEEDDPDTTEQK
ncbi:MAG: hypothetical protein IPG44_10545 [Anaerolineales bacterium]|jgi:hypothetical protein|nr:hypothetical protein [Chloroflexota bacterium]MBK6646167.1 hypothetical protein [Anaerolineales bacterium]MCC6985151.1 hypothetical protein [Anaerolineales bacterium]